MLPTFETRRLIVRPRTNEDLEDCLNMDRDPMVTRYIPGPWSDANAHRAFVQERMAATYPEGLGYWSVANKEIIGEILGWVLLLPYRAVGDETEIGWRFTRKHWGFGYATEAAAAVLHHAFQTCRLDAVVADIDARNASSIRVAEKLGMRYTEDRQLEGQLAKSFRITPQEFP